MVPRSPATVLVVHPYWDFWETSVASDLRNDRRLLLDQAIGELSRYARVVDAGLVGSPEQAARAAADAGPADAVVVVCSMAVPATTGMAFLDQVPELPVLLWALSRGASVDATFSHASITADGAPVGTPMLASALARQGRSFRVTCSTVDQPTGIDWEVASAAAAGRLAHGRILVVGAPIPGYTTVVPPLATGSGFAPAMAAVADTELAERVALVDPQQVRLLREDLSHDSELAQDIDQVGLDRALATQLALRELLALHQCTAGAFNCHGPGLRPNPDYGIAPCLALGRLTTEGTPFTCTGDVLTALAMSAVQELGHPTLYHEIEAIDYVNDEVVLSNSGEFDARLCPTSRVPLVRNAWYEHDSINAPCAWFTIAPGPATIVGFAYAPDPCFIVAEGSFTGRSFPRTGMPNAGFRFDSGNVAQAWPRWARSGALHHAAATNARIGQRIQAIAEHLGVSCVQV